LRPCRIVAVTRSSVAGAPECRYGFLKIPTSAGPCSDSSDRS
jgi:hypothetical protein